MFSYKKLLFGLSSFFVISFFSYLFLTATTNSRASTTGYIGFSQKQIQVQPDGNIRADILINSQVNISQVTLTISYPRNMYELKEDAMNEVSPECAKKLVLPAVERVQNNKEIGKVIITRSAGANSISTSGAHCFGTVTFQLIGEMRNVTQNPLHIETSQDATFALDLKGNYVPLTALQNARQTTVLGTETPPCMPTMDDTNCDGKHNEFDIKSPGSVMRERGLR